MYEKSRKKWSAEDLDYLRKNYDKVPTEQLAKNLQRKIGGIQHKAGELDLTKQSWKESDRQFLLDNYGKIKTREIAEKLGKTMRAVHKKASFMGLKVSDIKKGKTVQNKKQTSGVCHKSKWTRDEDEFLFQNIDKLTYEKLSQKLNREISDVKSRTKKFKLKRTTAYLKKYHNFIVENGEKKTAKEIADELEVPARLVKQYCRENDVYILMSKGKMKASVRAKNLGIEKKITKINSSMTFKDWCIYWMNTYKIGTSSNVTLEKYYICFCRWCESDLFWKWAENHSSMIEWNKVEKNVLGAEPEWVDEMRTSKIRSTDLSTKKKKWSKDEIEKLRWMLNQYKFTYPEICQELGRSHGAVKRKIHDLGIKQRPVYLPNTKKYSTEEVNEILRLYEKGYSFKQISTKLGRSEAGVRGKIERMGYTFTNKLMKASEEDDSKV